MTESPQMREKEQLLKVLKRARFPPRTIAALERDLPDRFDLDKHGAVLHRHGVTRDELINRMGGSP